MECEGRSCCHVVTCPFLFREYLANNVSVTVYPVNRPWLYSIMWCSGVSSVSSDAPQVLRKVSYPIWLMVNVSAHLQSASFCILIITNTQQHTNTLHQITPAESGGNSNKNTPVRIRLQISEKTRAAKTRFHYKAAAVYRDPLSTVPCLLPEPSCL